ncbi:hypothetical protein [Streptomyces scabiei]|uniref:hypothetical protein n=1 Tax=Streptomyces scabiei TaxID=1930 RepID=UPI000765ACF2|nr:hypothetical protein [Streptomyces scabiei]
MHPQPQRIVHKRGANHGLHIVLTILTCGLWAITGWPIAAMMGRKHVTTTYGGPQQQPYGHPQQGYPPQPYGQQPPPQYGPPPGATPPYGYPQQPPGPPQ